MNKINPLLLIIALFVLSSNCLYGKGLKVSVKTDADKLEFSYIYVNGTIVCVADSLGVAYVPMEKVNIGDTVSATFLGYVGDGVVYDSAVAESKEVNINLFPTFTADEVTVKADIMELYKKFVNKKQYLNATGQQFDFNFATDRVNGDNIYVKKNSGEASFQWSHMLELYKFPKFKMEGDTTNLKEDIFHAFYLIMLPAQMVCHSNFVSNIEHSREMGRFNRIAYKGVIDDYRIFTWTAEDNKNYFQRIYYFDKDSGFLKYSETHNTIEIPNKEFFSFLGKANYKNEKNSLLIVDGSIHIETSNKDRGSYDINICDVNSTRVKSWKFKEGVNAFKPKYPRFPSFWK